MRPVRHIIDAGGTVQFAHLLPPSVSKSTRGEWKSLWLLSSSTYVETSGIFVDSFFFTRGAPLVFSAGGGTDPFITVHTVSYTSQHGTGDAKYINRHPFYFPVRHKSS